MKQLILNLLRSEYELPVILLSIVSILFLFNCCLPICQAKNDISLWFWYEAFIANEIGYLWFVIGCVYVCVWMWECGCVCEMFLTMFCQSFHCGILSLKFIFKVSFRSENIKLLSGMGIVLFPPNNVICLIILFMIIYITCRNFVYKFYVVRQPFIYCKNSHLQVKSI